MDVIKNIQNGELLMSIMRLDKFLADMQTGTRSQVKEYIKKGRVKINGSLIKKTDVKLDTDKDTVLFDDKEVSFAKYEYYMLNKPAGVVSATRDAQKTVIELVASLRKDLFPVGRLDKDTEGLLLITNDGELAHKLLSPKKHVDKKYYALVKGKITAETAELFAKGFKVDEELTAMPSKLEILGYTEHDEESATKVYITINEGKFHQVKRMFKAVGSEVLYLKRLSMGSLVLDETLMPGEYRRLSDEELNDLIK